jgi:hypothetical protein
MAVTGFKWFGDKLGVGARGGRIIFDERLGHFETTETNGHNVDRCEDAMGEG